jgi:MFS family permease
MTVPVFFVRSLIPFQPLIIWRKFASSISPDSGYTGGMTETSTNQGIFGGIRQLFRENPMLLTLTLIMFTNMMGFGMIAPVIPLYGRTFDVSSTMIGLLVTSFGLARLVSNIPAGRLADRIGRRKLLIVGPLISSLGAFLAFLANDYWMLAAGIATMGVGSATYATAAMTTLADI